MPFFTALYGVLSSVAKGHPIGVINGALLASAGKAHIFGAPLSASFVHSTSTNVKIVTAVMIVMMSASQFITQRQLMTKNIDLSVKTPFMQQQKMLMYVFPVMFAVMGINFPVGVLVYWLTTNIWSMGQQLIVIRNNPTPGSQAWDERQARLKAAGRLNPDGTVIKGNGPFGFLGAGKAAAQQQAAAALTESVQVRRQQPRRQTKAQRQQVHTGAVKAEEAKEDAPEDAAPVQDAVPSAQGAGKAQASSGSKRPATKQGGGSAKRGPQQGGAQRPKKKP
jgi:YidC/Oxa1 family membrane protein insertase